MNFACLAVAVVERWSLPLRLLVCFEGRVMGQMWTKRRGMRSFGGSGADEKENAIVRTCCQSHL